MVALRFDVTSFFFRVRSIPTSSVWVCRLVSLKSLWAFGGFGDLSSLLSFLRLNKGVWELSHVSKSSSDEITWECFLF